VLGFFTERGASGEMIARDVDPESGLLRKPGCDPAI